MNVLIGCEFSGIVREAFRAKGHQAWSCDLEPAEDGSHYHHQGDVLAFAASRPWDLGIFHPPCTFLCNSGAHWLGRQPDRRQKMYDAADFFETLWHFNIPRICVENPTPTRKAGLPDYTQAVQPWWFGDDASKRTCLWLKNLPPLVKGPNALIKKRYANQTPSGQNNLGPSKNRSKERSRTYPGIARAMAEAWG